MTVLSEHSYWLIGWWKPSPCLVSLATEHGGWEEDLYFQWSQPADECCMLRYVESAVSESNPEQGIFQVVG